MKLGWEEGGGSTFWKSLEDDWEWIRSKYTTWNSQRFAKDVAFKKRDFMNGYAREHCTIRTSLRYETSPLLGIRHWGATLCETKNKSVLGDHTWGDVKTAMTEHPEVNRSEQSEYQRWWSTVKMFVNDEFRELNGLSLGVERVASRSSESWKRAWKF